MKISGENWSSRYHFANQVFKIIQIYCQFQLSMEFEQLDQQNPDKTEFYENLTSNTTVQHC